MIETKHKVHFGTVFYLLAIGLCTGCDTGEGGEQIVNDSETQTDSTDDVIQSLKIETSESELFAASEKTALLTATFIYSVSGETPAEGGTWALVEGADYAEIFDATLNTAVLKAADSVGAEEITVAVRYTVDELASNTVNITIKPSEEVIDLWIYPDRWEPATCDGKEIYVEVFMAYARFADSRELDVTADAEWSCDGAYMCGGVDENTVTVGEDWLASGTLIATYGGKQAVASIRGDCTIE